MSDGKLCAERLTLDRRERRLALPPNRLSSAGPLPRKMSCQSKWQVVAGRSPDGQRDFFAFCAFWFARIASVMDRLDDTVAMSALGQFHN